MTDDVLIAKPSRYISVSFIYITDLEFFLCGVSVRGKRLKHIFPILQELNLVGVTGL